jgi:hypothetical protein
MRWRKPGERGAALGGEAPGFKGHGGAAEHQLDVAVKQEGAEVIWAVTHSVPRSSKRVVAGDACVFRRQTQKRHARTTEPSGKAGLFDSAHETRSIRATPPTLP